MTPAVVMRASVPDVVVNQRLPSEPATMRFGCQPPVGKGVTTPCGVTRPMVRVPELVNQTLPSGPDVIPSASLIPNPRLLMIGPLAAAGQRVPVSPYPKLVIWLLESAAVAA